MERDEAVKGKIVGKVRRFISLKLPNACQHPPFCEAAIELTVERRERGGCAERGKRTEGGLHLQKSGCF